MNTMKLMLKLYYIYISFLSTIEKENTDGEFRFTG